MKINNIELNNPIVLILERKSEISKVDKKEYFSYFVRATFRGKEKIINFMPKLNPGDADRKTMSDKASYDVLADVFGDELKANLYAYDELFEGGKVFMSYLAVYDDGEECIVCKVKPTQASDRQLMETYVCNRRRALQKQRAEARAAAGLAAEESDAKEPEGETATQSA